MALTRAQLTELKQSPVKLGENRVGRAMELAEITQLSLAASIGLNQPYISDVARNRYQTITVENAHKFADFFGCAIEDLFPAREAVAS